MSRDVVFGSYYPSTSLVHKLNPCVKLVLFIAFMVLIFLAKNFYAFIAIGGFLIFTILLSRVPITSVLKSLRTILFLIIFTVILNLFFSNGGNSKILLQIGKIKIRKNNVLFASFMALRLITLVTASALLTLTTTPIELADGVEVLLTPLALIKFPVHALALIMSIALRFIPTLGEKTEQILNAQKARGSEIDSGNFFKKIGALVPILIPLIIASIDIANQLADAMDARCYNGSKKRTRYKKMKVALKDIFAFTLIILLFVGVIFINKSLGGYL